MVEAKRRNDRRPKDLKIAAGSGVLLFVIIMMALTGNKSENPASSRPLLSSHEAAAVNNKRSLAARIKRSTKFQPVSCRDLLTANRNVAHAVTDPNRGILYGRYTTTNPPFWISLHNRDFDGTRWAVMDFGYYYENLQTQAFVGVLTQASSQHVHVVDVGGNIGWYSLVSIAAAQSMNKSIAVDVFEPNPRNRLRLCESLQLNNWVENEMVLVNIYPAGVSSTSGGSVKMGISQSGTGKLGVYDETNKTETVTFPLVALDDLADELGWTGADILKVDVEGLELEVFQGSKKFLKTGRVQNIFFEGNTRDEGEIVKFRAIVKLLIDSGSYAYKYGSWLGPNVLLATTLTY